jgi:hypothetical protein
LEVETVRIPEPLALVLIIANLAPVYGVLIPGWKVFPVIFLFSHENPDFWLSAFSDLLNGGNRGVFAEFLVGAVLGTTENARIEWDAADHIYRGRKIKVKSAAYLEHWLQSKPSRIAFPIDHIQRKHIKTAIPGLTLYPKPEVYVFCVFDVKDRSEADVLDMTKWLFYPVSAHRSEELV